MNFPRYLNPGNIEDDSDMWALEVYTTLQNPDEALVTQQQNLNVLHPCLTPASQGLPILVREEYELLWKSALEEYLMKYSCGGIVVSGQPGIGKSLFLHYALAHAIRERIPVAWCAQPDRFYLFQSTGVSRQRYCDGVPTGGNVLALFDTVVGLESPMSHFYGHQSDCFIIHATCPELSPRKEWSKQASAKVWVMDAWSATEIKYIKRLKPTEEGYYDPVEISAYLGPSARECAKRWRNTGNPAKDFGLEPLDFETSDLFFKSLQYYGIKRGNQRFSIHTFFFKTVGLKSSRPVYYYEHLHIEDVFPTKYLRDLALKSFHSLGNDELQEWCRRFRSHPHLRGGMYEVCAIHNGWIFQREATCYFKDSATFTLPGGLVPRHGDWSADIPANTFWISPPAYPTVDAVAVTVSGGKKCITFLQMSIAKEYGINHKGITEIWAEFDDLDAFGWRFVFVVPSKEIGERLSEKVLNVRPCHKRDRTVRTPGGCLVPPDPRGIPVGFMVVELDEEEQKAFREVCFVSPKERQAYREAFIWDEDEVDG